MSVAVRQASRYADYLEFELASPGRHEFAGGEIFAMSGGSPAHARLQAALLGDLRVALRGKPCVPYGPDLRLYVPALDESAYADAVVICGRVASDPRDPQAAANPTVVCEVLSPTTEAYDRGRKFEKYRRLESLQEYVLVAQDRAMVEVYRREGDTWVLRTYAAGSAVALDALGVRLSMDDLYAGMFDPKA